MVCKKHPDLTDDLVKANGRCKLCHRLSVKIAKEKYRDKINAWTRADRAANPQKYRDYEKVNRIKSGARRTEVEIARRRGITHQEYLDMFIRQENKCSICGKEESRKMKSGKVMKLALDHCHATNKNRELLCHNCNTAIGKIGDSYEMALKVAAYLLRHKT